MIRHHAYRGFSLLELSVALAVISLVAGFGISLGSNIMSGGDRITTQQRLVTIKQVLDAYGQKNGYLPCPSSRADTPDTATFGVELRDTNGTSCDVTTPTTNGMVQDAAKTIYIGALPTATLGLPASYAADAWGNKFLYAVSANHMSGSGSYSGILTGGTGAATTASTVQLSAANSSSVDNFYNGLSISIIGSSGSGVTAVGQTATITGYTGSTRIATISPNWTTIPYVDASHPTTYLINGGNNVGPITVMHGDRTGTNYPITTTAGTFNNLPAPGPGATYVVVSHGPDGKGAYPLNSTSVGTACPGYGTDPTTAAALAANPQNDIENCDDYNATFYDTDYNDGAQASTFFDDYIVWGTNALSRAPIADPGTLQTIAPAGIGAGTGCPVGICEPWCAVCKNAPLYTGSAIVTYVCSSTIAGNNPCQASCTYATFGTDVNGINQTIPCP